MQTRSNLNVIGDGDPILDYVLTYAVDTFNTLDNPFILPNCKINLSNNGHGAGGKGQTNAVWAIYSDATQIINLSLVKGVNTFVADEPRTIKVSGNISMDTVNVYGGVGIVYGTNISAIELNGDQDVSVISLPVAIDQGLDIDNPILLNKTNGKVTIYQATIYVLAMDTIVLSGRCPTLELNPPAGSGYVVTSPFQLNGDLTVNTLIMNNGIA